MIIVEGPDGAGKTTLVKHLAKELNGEAVISHGDIPKDPLQKMANAFVEYYKWIENPEEYPLKIYDRLLFSESVYGRVLRGRKYSPGFARSFRFMAEHVAKLGIPVVFCLPDIHEVKANVQDETSPQMGGVKENIDSIYEAYEEEFFEYSCSRGFSDDQACPITFLHDYNRIKVPGWQSLGDTGFIIRPPAPNSTDRPGCEAPDIGDWLSVGTKDLTRVLKTHMKPVKVEVNPAMQFLASILNVDGRQN